MAAEILEISRILDNPIFREVSRQARKLGVRAFVIGGFVRDFFLGIHNDDIDIVVESNGRIEHCGIALAQATAEALGSKVSVFRNFGTAMFKFHGTEVEFVGTRRESYRSNSRKPIVEDGTLEEDQLRRDFTINAMAFSLQKEDFGRLIDPFGGIKDLNLGLIRTPLDPDTTYSDDPLRMIRAVRFATRLDFDIVPESVESMRRNSGRLRILSAERISEELNKIMMTGRPSKGFRLLDECGLLETILPELHALKGVEVIDGHGHKDVFLHTLKVLDNISAPGNDTTNPDNVLWLRWAALLHDIGKAQTKKYDPRLGWTFHAHDFIGAKMVPGVFRRLKLPQNEALKYVQKLVQLHLRPIALVTDQVTDSAVRRLLFDASDDVDDLMLLCKADITSKNEMKVETFRANYDHVKEKLVEIEAKDAVRNFHNPVSGEMIMETFGLSPCREVGLIKEYIKEAILDGRCPNEPSPAMELMFAKAAEMGLKPKD